MWSNPRNLSINFPPSYALDCSLKLASSLQESVLNPVSSNMGERKGELKYIMDETERMATFYRLREEILKEAAEISEQEGVEIAIAGFTPNGEPYAFGHPTTSNVFDHFLQGGSSSSNQIENNNSSSTQIVGHFNQMKLKELEEQFEHEKLRKTEAKFWWDTIDINQCNSLDELLAVQAELEKVKQKVLKQLEDKS